MSSQTALLFGILGGLSMLVLIYMIVMLTALICGW